VQHDLRSLDHQRVTSVRTAGVADDRVRVMGKDVDNLPFTFISPLGSDDDYCGHFNTF
jgi:hypothetical protein